MSYLGTDKLGRVFLGTVELSKIYLGEDLIFQKDQPIVYKTVQDLISEGYAETISGTDGTYIRILPTCPYPQENIVNLSDVALNQEQIVSGTKNTIIWDTSLPSGWTPSYLAAIYDGKTMNFTPRANMLWAITGLDTFSIGFTPDGIYKVNDYPWGNGGNNNGVFAPRYNANNEADYARKGFRNSPKTLTVTIAGEYGSVAQTMFTHMEQTTTFNLIVTNPFLCHDVTGMFEGCYRLTTLNITGPFRFDYFRLCHNLFLSCGNLTSVPYVTAWGRNDETNAEYNTIYPRYTGTRGSADCHGMFDGCSSLAFIGPRINMNAISLSGCVIDGINQSALSSDMFDCPQLTDVRIINLNNNSWNFADRTTYTYIPKMDVASIEFLLNHVADCTADPHTVTFSTLHQGEISATAITNANNKGWTVAYQAVS